MSYSLDRELRSLLSVCFTGPDEDQVFSSRRYWKEPPAVRWIMRNAEGNLIGHVAAHDKTVAVVPAERDAPLHVDASVEELRIAGIAEVCVYPAARGLGHAKNMLGVAHLALEDMGFDFAALFGDPDVYRSSGYRTADNLVRFFDDTQRGWTTTRFDDREDGAFLWRPLACTEWPEGGIDIRGPKF